MTVHDTHTPGRKAPAYKPADWLPTSLKEVRARGWDELDVILFSGDAYIDHPSFGAAVIGRLLEAEGLRVAIVPQPNWKDDLRDFRKLGRPRLFFGVSGGAMDSMVNHYTANKRLRSDDAYTAGGKAGFRPDYVVTVYTRILKQLYPDTPVIIGGIEASLRRTTHYDYWSDSLKPSVLVESGADLLIYGMGDKTMPEIARAMRGGYNLNLLRKLPQVAFLAARKQIETLPENRIMLHSFERCLKDKKAFGENFVRIETESNSHAGRHIGRTGGRPVRGGQSPLSFYLGNRFRPQFRIALHAPAAPALQRQRGYPGLRNDQILGQPAPGMLRGMQLLHDFGPSGQVRFEPQRRVDPQRGLPNRCNARFQRLPFRPGRPVGQTCTA